MEAFHGNNAHCAKTTGNQNANRPVRTSAPGSGPRCLAVMYHYVHDVEPLSSAGVGGLTTREFCAQLDRLCSRMAPTDWPALYAWTKGRHNIPERSFILTFDDGLADHVNVVLPILQERNLRGVFFVPGAVLATERLLSAHAIHILLATMGETRLRDDLLAFLADHGDETDYTASLDTKAAERMYHYETPSRAHLKYLLTVAVPIDRRRAAIRTLFEEHVGSLTRWSRSWYLHWEDVVRLEHAGHTVGGHGYGHEPYHRLTSNEARQDVHRTAAVLHSGLGNDLRPFSYPYGGYDDAITAACREAGFAQAFTTRRGWITQHTDPYELPRVDTIDVDAVLEEEFACVST